MRKPEKSHIYLTLTSWWAFVSGTTLSTKQQKNLVSCSKNTLIIGGKNPDELQWCLLLAWWRIDALYLDEFMLL